MTRSNIYARAVLKIKQPTFLCVGTNIIIPDHIANKKRVFVSLTEICIDNKHLSNMA